MSPMKSKNCKINQLDANGNRTGLWRGYWDNGKLDYEGNYINGLKHGIWKEGKR